MSTGSGSGTLFLLKNEREEVAGWKLWLAELPMVVRYVCVCKWLGVTKPNTIWFAACSDRRRFNRTLEFIFVVVSNLEYRYTDLFRRGYGCCVVKLFM